MNDDVIEGSTLSLNHDGIGKSRSTLSTLTLNDDVSGKSRFALNGDVIERSRSTLTNVTSETLDPGFTTDTDITLDMSRFVVSLVVLALTLYCIVSLSTF